MARGHVKKKKGEKTGKWAKGHRLSKKQAPKSGKKAAATRLQLVSQIKKGRDRKMDALGRGLIQKFGNRPPRIKKGDSSSMKRAQQ